ncbi:hypothetical protein U9M48_039240 [Paspalum notatum var. saurae]|uniref:Disease resistance protein At4g27190-like leucine-rich repeats domain-containing protein n=1 Tax=Paspalum notatum var. saurae TaxID=547442 RepID=A0AAQ3UNK2_PASNO
MLDLKDGVVQVPSLQRVILLGCEKIPFAMLWPKNGMPNLMLLCIDTGRAGARPKTPHDDFALVSKEHEGYCHARVAVTDMRFLQSLLLASGYKFCWNTARSKIKDKTTEEKMGPYSPKKLVASPLHKSQIPKSHRTYASEINFDKATEDHDGSSVSVEQFQPLEFHLEIGVETSSTNVVTEDGIRTVRFLINRVQSLHVHDNSSIDTVIPGSVGTRESWSGLRSCSIERCPNLNTVFTTDARDLSGGSSLDGTLYLEQRMGTHSDFGKLRAINLYMCPRLTFTFPLSWSNTLSSLETLCIVSCDDLYQIFPIEAEFLKELPGGHPIRGDLELPELKHIFLHELHRLRRICPIKNLETIWVRGCWSLKRLPATSDCPDSSPVVNCKNDWWKKLECDGKEACHHPSLFEQRHSNYYKNTMLRRSVLR